MGAISHWKSRNNKKIVQVLKREKKRKFPEISSILRTDGNSQGETFDPSLRIQESVLRKGFPRYTLPKNNIAPKNDGFQ